MRIYTKYRAVSESGRKPRRWRAILWIIAVLLAGVVVRIVWKQGYFSHRETSRSTSSVTNIAAATNAPLIIPTNSNVAASQANSRPGRSAPVLEAQIALDRLGISSGSIDGVLGPQTRAALRAFQLREGLSQTGALDSETSARLVLSTPALTSYRVDALDVSRLLPLSSTWLGKSEQERLDYESLIEAVAERSHSHPNLIRRLNRGIVWDDVVPGTTVTVPATERERPVSKAAFIQIRLGERTLEAFDSSNRLLAHFPCSIAQRMDKRPVGELRVAVMAPNPNYTFDPEVFPESAEARELGRKLVLPPGPNNPVGTVWIGLDRPGYGIHGTPKPEDVGRTESHGCFRLANWNAQYLLSLVTIGTPVRVEL